MKKNVLAVSTDKSLLKLLKKELERPDLSGDFAPQNLPPAKAGGAFWNLVIAASGKEAAELLEKKTTPFDLLILDSNLPGGWRDVLEKAQKTSLFTDTILLGTKDIEDEAADTGVSFVIDHSSLEEEIALKAEIIFKGQEFRDEDLDRFTVDELRRDWLDLTASSELECVERFRQFAELIYSADLDDKATRDLTMAINELGLNAVEWGNRFDKSKRIHLSYAVFDDRIMLKIEDEGKGFDFRHMEDPTLDPLEYAKKRQKSGKRVGGYGVYLVRKLMDQVIFNEKGNVVIMTKMLRKTGPKPDNDEDREK